MIRVRDEDLDYGGERALYYFEGEPFTGLKYWMSDDGKTLEGECEYRGGMAWGRARGWYEPGRLECDEQFFAGHRHGLCLAWYPDGKLEQEAFFDCGTALWGTKWDEDGNVIKEFHVKESDAAYDVLVALRQFYERTGGYESPSPTLEPWEQWRARLVTVDTRPKETGEESGST